jgi:serine protease Do
MKKILGLAVAMLSVSAAMAQTKPASPKAPQKKVIEEKVFVTSPDDKEKTVIVIEDGKVTINGKPAAEFKGNKRIVINGNTMSMAPNAKTKTIVRKGEPKAFLGVGTEPGDKGAKVIEVVEESAAAKAGLQVGDVILQVNEEKINSPESLSAAVRKHKPESVVDLVYEREGKEKKTKVTLGKNEDMFTMEGDFDFGDEFRGFNFNMEPPVAMTMPRNGQRFEFRGAPEGFGWFGPNDRPKYGLNVEDNPDGDGAKVSSVEAESNAQKAGLQKDDIITGVEDKTIKTVDDLREALAESREKTSVSIKLQRNGKAETLTLKVPKKIKTAEL